MNVISKQLFKIAQLLKADADVDSTEHNMNELCLWIKKALNKLGLDNNEIKEIIKTAEYKKVYTHWDGVLFVNNKDNIEFRKSFVVPFKQEFVKIIEKTAEEKNLFVEVTNKADKEIIFSFKLTLDAEHWYPLFRSCKEFSYDENNGLLDDNSLKELEKSLQKCFNELTLNF